MNEQIEQDIIAGLKNVYDPEIPVNIYELGLIYEIRIDENNDVEIVMTLTSPSCPEAEVIPGQIEAKAASVEGVKSVKINLTFDPPWTQDLMSEEAKLELGML